MFKSFIPSKIVWKIPISFCLIFGLVGCGNVDNGTTIKINPKQPINIKGAGATFPAPLYQLWIKEYTSNKEKENINIVYDSVGSGAGVTNYLEEKVDFGATDAPLKTEEKDKFPLKRGNPLQIPMTGGIVVFAYNLSNFEGLDNIKLSRENYCGIVTGEIKQWSDSKIAKDNPNVKLPDIPIIFVHRSDGSGTTFIFTSHIKAACPKWSAGAGKKVEWPTGLGADGNKGVIAQIQQTQGAIGYTEYSYAKDNKVQMAIIQNKKGQFIKPSSESGSQAFSGINVPDDFALVVPDPDNANAYPIVGLTWLLIYGNYEDAMKKEVIKDFVQWSLTKGDESASKLGYLPIPDELEQKVIMRINDKM